MTAADRATAPAAAPVPEGARLARPERRQQLLAAARRVFVEKGYHATAMGDIAERAGVSKPVLYQHFEGKLDLYLALLEEQLAEMVRVVNTALASTAVNRDRVQAVMAAFFEFVDREEETFRLVFESDLIADAAVRRRVDRATTEIAAATADVIAADTDLTTDQAWLLGVAMTGQAQVAARAWLAAGRTIPRDEAAALVARLSWRGVRGFPATGHQVPPLAGTDGGPGRAG
ncbi:MAG: TetR/AcrR family transcriptional regulator [Kineosporiaceae bacterium]